MKVSFLCTLLCIAHGLWLDTQDTEYYAILGVRRTASLDEIKSAYKALIFKLHPDRNGLDLLANEKSAMINAAYHTLRNEYRRAQYDTGHPSAGKWEEKNGQFAYNYFKRYATFIWEFVVKRGKTEKAGDDLGVFLAFTAAFVYRSRVMMFLLIWIVVENKPHLLLMIWISAKLIKLKTKYLLYLAFLWIIYLIIIRCVHESLTSDFNSRIFIFLSNYPTLFVLYFIVSVIATVAFFWRYKPHQNQQIKLTIFLVQHVTAFLHLSETMEGETSYLDVMITQLIIVAISEISWIILKHLESLIRSDFFELYTFCEVRCRRIANFLLRFIQQSGACLDHLIRRLSFHVESPPNISRIYHVTAIAVAELYNETVIMCCSVFHCIFNISHRRSANEAHERRLLTNVEYIMEGRHQTREQLILLRQNCQRMPIMRTWHVAGVLSNTQRFAGFVLGEDHVTIAEREEHARSSTIYPVRTDDQEDST